MKNRIVLIYLLIAPFFLTAMPGMATELRLAGVLGNSGESGVTLATFSGQPASGIGPVLDDAETIWERGGSRQLNRYALDGRLLATYELPESTDRNDQMTRIQQHLLFELRGSLYLLRLDSEPGSKPELLPGHADVISSNSFERQVAIFDAGELYWFEPVTGQRTRIVKPDFNITGLHLGEDGTVFGFGGGNVYAWKDGKLVKDYPKGFRAERPQKIGDSWYGHGWHGTIHRMNSAFEPEPGVVLGGASGTFIGYLPESSDLTNGRGLVHVRDNLFAVSGLSGVVQLIVWHEDDSRFELVRRIGPLCETGSLALDAKGNIWTPSGCWRWSDTTDAPRTLGDVRPALNAQPIVLNNKTLCLLKKHYSYVQLAHGPLIDTSGWSRLDIQGISDLELSESISGAAVFMDSKGRLTIIATCPDGEAFEIPITPTGQMAGQPIKSFIPGLSRCTSLAWLDGQLLAADQGNIIIYNRTTNDQWIETSRCQGIDGEHFGDEIYIHSDGHRLAVSDTDNGSVHLCDSLKNKVATYAQLSSPKQIAVSGDRIVVYEMGNQRLVKLELTDIANMPERRATTFSNVAAKQAAEFTDADYLDISHHGIVPVSIALAETTDGLAVSLRTDATRFMLGIAGAQHAYIVSDQATVLLPPDDWSDLRLAVALETGSQRDRIGLLDHRAIHVPLSENGNDWAPFDLANYRETVNERKQQIGIDFVQPIDGKATIVIENQSGKRVRNLVSGRSFSAGRHTVIWDGLDEAGRLVAPGSYRWRGATHPGIEPDYKMNFANGGEDTIAPWGPNHGLLHDVVTNGELIFFAAPVTEGGWALLALDKDGNFVQGYEHQQGFGIGHNAIAVDDQYLYCAQDGFGWSGTRGIDFSSNQWVSSWNLTVARYDIRTGKVVEFSNHRRAFEADTIEVGPGSTHPDLNDYNLGGLAILDGKLYVGSRAKNAVLVFDAASGDRIDTIALPGVRHLTATDQLFAATDSGVVWLSDRKLLIPSNQMDITGIAFAPDGDILISDRNSHQIHRFNAEGKPVATIGTPGGPYKGAYDRRRMVNPTGLAFGPDGKLWVTEKRWNPKRILAWDLDKNEVVYEKFGMPHYGGDGSGFDPENRRRWVGLGCLWDVDIQHRLAYPTHVMALDEGHFEYYHPHSYSFFREAGRTFLCARGKIVLISELLDDGTIRDLAATAGTHHFAYGCNWEPPQAYIDAFYEKWPEKKSREKPGRGAQGKPWAERVAGVIWVDRNADGRPQQQEFDFSEEGIQFADGAWGHQQSSLTLYIPAVVGSQTKVVAIRPDGFLSNGVPDYPTLNQAIEQATDVGLTPGYKRNGVATVRDRFGRFIFNSDPEMNAFDAEGRHLWSYPNQWSNVHGSHDAPLPQTGVMQGTLGILGIAPLDNQADLFFLNGNHGRCFLLTTDGLYLDELFSDVRVSYLKNEYRLGGEIFGGSFGRSEPDGRYYVQIGHGPYRIYELTGINDFQRISGTLTVSSDQIAAAHRSQLRQVAEQQTEKKFSIPGTIRWDQSGRFKSEVDLAVEGDQLHITWRVEDPSPWINAGRDWRTLFATGDTVDLQIGVDPNAATNRREPTLGDKRLMIAPYETGTIAVLYEHRKPGGNSPVEFTSPWRSEKVDNVQQLPEASIDVKLSGRDYTVDAKIPLESLGLNVTRSPLRADFGVTFGDAGGTETQLRSYWSNTSTMLTDDIPGEIMLHPNLWGEIQFRVDKESTIP